MENYAVLSIETHLFFARIMKEHALFLEAGFPCKEKSWLQRSEEFRCQFEELLRKAVELSEGMAGRDISKSGEMVTEFTLPAEQKTRCLTGIAIDTELTETEMRLCGKCEAGTDEGRMDCRRVDREVLRTVHQLNDRAVCLLNGFIEFKESILREVKKGKLFTANYPLLIQHILREARMYRDIVWELMQNRQTCGERLWEKEEFWNQIMMEHALFIRGLLDPSEVQLICTADEFAETYQKLLEEAKKQDCRAAGELTEESLEETLRYRAFKEAGAEGILECKISSIILPLLADHVLREANHYIRLLQTGRVG